MRKQTLIWQIVAFVLGLIFVLTVREYLLDKNEIEAETATANCRIEMRKIDIKGFAGDYCSDIKTYKLKFNK